MTTKERNFEALRELNEGIDQLAGCSALNVEADACLKLAWWFTEDAIREATGKCSNGDGCKSGCYCCASYIRLTARAHAIRSRL